MTKIIRDISLIIIISILSFLIILCSINTGNYRFDSNEINNLVGEKKKKYIQECGQGYYFSFLSVKDDIANIGTKKIEMISQFGYVPIKTLGNRVMDTKWLNNKWTTPIEIKDYKSITFLNSLDENKPRYEKDISKLMNIPTIKELITRSNITPVTGGFAIVKQYSNIIYVFILSNTSTQNESCGEEETKRILNEITGFTKGLL